MNVEAQAINVPTGLQDYRPALYGGIAALELEADGVQRVPLDVDLAELQQRIVLCYTGEPRNSGTNNWEITKRHIDGDRYIFDCFERIRDTAADMREALAARRLGRGRARHRREWENRKRLAPGVTTPAIEDLIARATAAGATAAKVCGAGGGGCLFCYGPPGARAAIADGAGRRRRAAARLHVRAPRAGAWITSRSRRCLAQIADLLEIKGENAFKIRAYRSAADVDRRLARRRRPHGRAAAPRDSRHRQGPRRRRSASWPTPGRLPITRSCSQSSRRRSSTCCAFRASGRRRWRCSTRR